MSNIQVKEEIELDFGIEENELSDSWEECIDLITGNINLIMKKSAKVYWFTGKVIEHMQKVHGAGTVAKIAEETNYSERSLYYMQSAYTAFPNYADVEHMVDHGLIWTNIKELARLPEENREEAVQDILRNNVDVREVSEYVNDIMSGGEDDEEVIVLEEQSGPDTEETDNTIPGTTLLDDVDIESKEDPEEKAKKGLADEESPAVWVDKFHQLLVRIQKNQLVDLKDIKDILKKIDPDKMNADDYKDAKDKQGVILDELYHIKEYVEAAIELF